jgi:hypothetical protein
MIYICKREPKRLELRLYYGTVGSPFRSKGDGVAILADLRGKPLGDMGRCPHAPRRSRGNTRSVNRVEREVPQPDNLFANKCLETGMKKLIALRERRTPKIKV